MPEEKFSLKDHLFNRDKVQKIAVEIAVVYPEFKTDSFVNEVVVAFPKLELKQRIEHIADCFSRYLPANFETAVRVLLNSLPEPCNPDLNDNDFGDFIYAPHSHFVAVNGCDKANIDLALRALEQMTTRFSAEFSIRFFINTFPHQTLQKIQKWCNHTHYHVRRLAVEGSRPKLPWSEKVKLKSGDTLPFLKALHADSTRYVTRSVANHLNDISKTDPDTVLDTLREFKALGLQNPDELDFIIKHSTRTLVKQGHSGALAMLGYPPKPQIEVSRVQFPAKVHFNEALHVAFSVFARSDAKLMVDYIIMFQNKRGALTREKVFKLKRFTLSAGETAQLVKKHPMPKQLSTRTLYPGKYQFKLQINGSIVFERYFDVCE